MVRSEGDGLSTSLLARGTLRPSQLLSHRPPGILLLGSQIREEEGRWLERLSAAVAMIRKFHWSKAFTHVLNAARLIGASGWAKNQMQALVDGRPTGPRHFPPLLNAWRVWSGGGLSWKRRAA
jgi:hypothetical protein